MKKIFVILGLLIAGSGFAEPKQGLDVSVEVGIFHNPLARYGHWIESDWGNAWQPSHRGHGWRPYMDGRWVWTDYGWYWLSNEPFGWATYHYGRWQYDDYYGWIWIPDNQWGPAWVEWRYDTDYIGWAPLPPFASFSFRVGLRFSRHWVAPVHYWNFTRFSHFTSDRVGEYVERDEGARRVYDRSREGRRISGEDNRVVNRGIDMKTLEEKTRTKIRRTEIIDRGSTYGERMVRDGNKDRIETYRPKNVDSPSEVRNERGVRGRFDSDDGRNARRDTPPARVNEGGNQNYQNDGKIRERKTGVNRERPGNDRPRVETERRPLPDRQMREGQREQSRPSRVDRPSERKITQPPGDPRTGKREYRPAQPRGNQQQERPGNKERPSGRRRP